VPSAELLGMRMAAWTFDRPWRLGTVQRLAGLGRRVLGDRGGLGPLPLPGPAAKWSRARDVPLPPRESFRSWWRRRHRNGRS
jgi:L-lactate dehydrogenase complex protein LldF